MDYKIVARHNGRALMILGCKQACQIPLREGEQRVVDSGQIQIWGWNGKEESATVTPSIACTKCDFHKTLTSGVWT